MFSALYTFKPNAHIKLWTENVETIRRNSNKKGKQTQVQPSTESL